MQVKTCSKCGKTKSIEMFFRYKKDSEFRHGQCKDCMARTSKKWHTEHKMEHAAQSKKWAKDNPEKIKVMSRKNRRQYYSNNKESVDAYNAKWRVEHKDKYDAWKKQYDASYMPKYHAKNPEKLHESRQRRRARIANAGGAFTSQEWVSLCEKYHYICLACGITGVPMSPDHIVPLSKGGSNSIDNIQPLCVPCNKKKHTKIIDYRNGVYAQV